MGWLAMAAYPALLLAIYGTYRVGRSRASPDERFERARLCALGLMMALLMGVQWHLIATGVVRSPMGLAAATVGIGAASGLVGLHVLDRRARRRRDAPAGSPAQ